MGPAAGPLCSAVIAVNANQPNAGNVLVGRLGCHAASTSPTGTPALPCGVNVDRPAKRVRVIIPHILRNFRASVNVANVVLPVASTGVFAEVLKRIPVRNYSQPFLNRGWCFLAQHHSMLMRISLRTRQTCRRTSPRLPLVPLLLPTINAPLLALRIVLLPRDLLFRAFVLLLPRNARERQLSGSKRM